MPKKNRPARSDSEAGLLRKAAEAAPTAKTRSASVSARVVQPPKPEPEPEEVSTGMNLFSED